MPAPQDPAADEARRERRRARCLELAAEVLRDAGTADVASVRAILGEERLDAEGEPFETSAAMMARLVVVAVAQLKPSQR